MKIKNVWLLIKLVATLERPVYDSIKIASKIQNFCLIIENTDKNIIFLSE